MDKSTRIQLAIVVVLADFLFFVAPLGAILLAYVLVTRPEWFKSLVDRVYKGR